MIPRERITMGTSLEGLKDHDDVCDCYGEHEFLIFSGPKAGSTYKSKTYNIPWHRELMNPDLTMSVGLNDDGTVDEVLTDGCPIHIEQMSDQVIWMCIDHRYIFNFYYVKGKKICLSYSYDDGVTFF